MSERTQTSPNLPSGYESAKTLPEVVTVGRETLPWLSETHKLSVAECKLQSGETFLLASAVGTHPKLVEAAQGMTEGQSRNANNMFYSRIPTVISEGYSPSVETLPNPSTESPISVLRNKGGQRVYFTRAYLGLEQEQEYGPTIVKLAVCDKNKQGAIFPILTNSSPRQINRKLSK